MTWTWKLLAALLSLALFVLPVGAEASPDPFGLSPCIILDSELPDGQHRQVAKIIRWANAMESPFHLPLDELRLPLRRHNREHPDGMLSSLYVGHGGYVFGSSADLKQSMRDLILILTPWFGRPTVPDIQCIQLGAGDRPQNYTLTDPYTGNVFVANMQSWVIDLVVIDPSGREVARIRTELTSDAPLDDLSGKPFAELEASESGLSRFFWFDLERLAPLVDVYRQIGGEAYARFIVDAFLLPWVLEWNDEWPDVEGMRLPALPLRGTRPLEASTELDRLQGMRANHPPFFRPRKPRKGGIASGLLPVLKLIEAHDCLRQVDETGPDSCPAYSAMALHTEFYRLNPELLAGEEGFFLADVFDVIARRGLCRESLYPFPSGAALGWPDTIEKFASLAEKQLNRMLRSRQQNDPMVAEFVESLQSRRIEFVDLLPPLCAADMQHFLEEHGLAGHQLAELNAAQHLIGSPLPESDTNRLRRAQQQELSDLTLRLLADGVPAAIVTEDEDILVAYGTTPDGLVVHDLLANEESARERTIMPHAEFQSSVDAVAYLRDDFEGQPATIAQLRRSLHYAPDVEWTHYWLGQLLQAAGRHGEAIESLQRSVELDDDDAYNWRDLGESLSSMARFGEAADAFEKAINLGLDTAYCHGWLGYVQHKLGRFSAATGTLRRAIELNPDNAWAMRQLGWTHHDERNEAAAEPWFRKAREHAPESVINYTEFAQYLSLVGRPEEAREVLLDAAQSFSEASALGSIGHNLYFIGYPKDAGPVLEQAFGLEEDSAWYRLALSRVYRALGDTDRLPVLLEPIESNPVSRRPDLINLAYAQALLGKREACRETVGSFLDGSGQLDGGQYFDLTCIRALNGEFDLALEALGQALKLGYQDCRWARHDLDLVELAEDPRFRELLDQYCPNER